MYNLRQSTGYIHLWADRSGGDVEERRNPSPELLDHGHPSRPICTALPWTKIGLVKRVSDSARETTDTVREEVMVRNVEMLAHFSVDSDALVLTF
ncbi:hypothetical protein GCM10009069_13970 [Algimonas arctica]|uniref:Uncharacterized protein n=1 Tax=Algimonas arctica TaxID=1479486 RepID=A0A8J3CPY2_9PROT|nr:hypothetical protein GCM10009069_13970 [Algimonas arctica]